MLQINLNPLALYGHYVPPTFESKLTNDSVDPEVLERSRCLIRVECGFI